MPRIYSIDTSALVHAWQRDYPPDVFPSVWEKLDELATSDRLISCDEALLELERGGDDLHEWAVDRPHIFRTPDQSVQTVVSDIVNRWPEVVPEESHDGVWADPYIIAFAVVQSGTVITGEIRVGQNARRPHIPNVCEALNVPWSNLLGLLRYEGYNF
jgi:hypothetical protein